MKTSLRYIAVCVSVLLLSCQSKDSNNTEWKKRVQNPENLHRSIKKVTDVIVHDIFSPPVASRIYAYLSVAAYETVVQGSDKYQTLAGQLHGLPPTPKPGPGELCFEIAAVQAVLGVGKALVFSEDKIEAFKAEVMKEYAEMGVPEEVFERSIAYGDTVASHILKWSGKDNYKQSRSFPKYTILVDDASTWKPTPPAYMDAVEPHWNKIRTFVLDSAGQFKPAPPTPFSTEKKSRFYKEAMEVYEVGKSLTEEQEAIARFWDCNPFVMNVKGHVMFATKKISPGGHWINITNVACHKANADFGQSAEAYARVALALFEGFVSCWDEKYRSKLIRPETYINQYIDEDWVPLLQTPPFPEYTSGHSVISAASAVTLTKIFGENFSFVDSTEVEFGMPSRSFNSFVQAADEAAVSRLYGGIHYRPAIENGVIEGRALGDFVYNRVNTRKVTLADAK